MLGRIFLIFFCIFLNAAELKINSDQIIQGEALKIELIANGKDIKFPNLTQINSYDLIGPSVSYKSFNINGKVTNTKSHTYVLYPDHNFTIPKFKIIVDGKEEFTKEQEIEVTTYEKLNKKIPYKIELQANKERVYFGENINLLVKIMVDDRLELNDIRNLAIEGFENFTIIDQKQENFNKNGYKNIIISYTINALKLGKINLNASVNLGFASGFSSFFSQSDYKSILSKKIELEILPLPNNAKIIGDFNITSFVDTQNIKAQKPTNLTILIKGKGNLSNLDSVFTDINNTIAYPDKPKITSNFNEDVWEQKIAIMALDDFTIPSFEVSVFDIKQNKIKTIKTEPIHIKVQKNNQKSTQIIETKNPQIVMKNSFDKKIAFFIALIAFAIGLIVGYVLSFVKLPKKNKNLNIFKSEKDLFLLSIAFANKNKELDLWIEKLEENLYQNGSNKIDKSAILKLLKDLKAI